MASMVHLIDAEGAFHAEVIAARLRVEGIRSEVRGGTTWPWPGAGTISLYVRERDLPDASELLLYDEVDAAFAVRTRSPRRVGAGWLVAMVIVVALVSTVTRWF